MEIRKNYGNNNNLVNIIIIIIKTFKVLIKEEKRGKSHIRQEGDQIGHVGWNFSKTGKLHIRSIGLLKKNEKKECQFKRKGGVFMPPFASFVDQTKEFKGLRPSGVVGDKKRREKRKERERKRREKEKEWKNLCVFLCLSRRTTKRT